MNNSLLMGIVIGLLAIVTVPLVMTTANASILPRGSSGHFPVNPNSTIVHINEAQSALQNGDTESANNHLELAKQSLQGNQSNSGQ
ncbi:MAG: hypothetical protein ACRD8W_21600 [Nitrososphaeraceae archaeon]